MTQIDTILRRQNPLNINQDIIKRFTPINSDVTLYGIKRPDIATFDYSIEASDILEGDEISYIQDIVDVDYLAGIWHFELSARDERGMNFDGFVTGNVDPPESRFIYTSTGSFSSKGLYAIQFTDAEHDVVAVPNSVTLNNWCDFSDQFDVYVWCVPGSSTGNRIILSKFNGTNGFEIGFTGEQNNEQTCFIRYKKGDGAPQTAIGTQMYRSSSQPLLLRCWKKFGKLNVSINGLQEISIDHTETLTSSADLKFGGGNLPTESYRGQIQQIRIYGGTAFDKTNADIIYGSKITPTTMKFAGRIIDINDVTTHKTVNCRSWGEVLYSKQLVENLYMGESDIRINDIYNAVANVRPILEDIINRVDPTIILRTLRSLTTPDHQIPIIKGAGRVSNLLQMILTFFEYSFRLTPRKLLIIERPTSNDTDYVFRHLAPTGFKYDVRESESRNFNAVSDILLIGYNGEEGFQRGTDITKAIVLRLPFVTGSEFLNILSSRLRTQSNNQITRYEIKSPVFTNHIRILHDVSIIPINGMPHNSIIVAEINYKYPSWKTIINCGANVIDYVDYQSELESQIASSGVSVASSVVAPPVSSNPSVTISSPANNEGYAINTQIPFVAVASDVQDGDISNDIVWTANGITIGTGRSVSTSLSVGTYTIVASITDSNGQTSTDTRTITVSIPVPSPVGALTSSISGATISLSWTDVPTATGYNIYRQTSSSYVLIGTSQISEYTDDTLGIGLGGRTILYRVTATNAGGESIPSSSTSETIPDAPVPPDSVEVFNDPDHVLPGNLVIRIELEEGQSACDVLYSTDNNTYHTLITNVTVSTDQRIAVEELGFAVPHNSQFIYIAHENLLHNQQYHYRVYGRNVLGRSTDSTDVINDNDAVTT